MDPWEKDNKNKYHLIGLGPKSDDMDLAKKQYDPNYEHYDPQPKDKD